MADRTGADLDGRLAADAAGSLDTRSSLLRRHGAALVLDLGDGSIEACTALAEDLDGRLLALARDADVYAVVARGCSPMASHAGRGERRAIIDRRVWELECFSKPLVTLLSGSPSSSALALALAGTHRVAGDAFACEITDVRRGAVPPGIVVHALSRLPDGIGAYLMLTGCIVGAADALGLGFITHCIADAQFDAIIAALADADPVDPVLDVRHLMDGDSALEPVLELASKHFSAGSIDAIFASLGSETGPNQVWAATAAVQTAQVPKAAAIAALATLERAKALDVRDTIILAARANVLLVAPDAARLDEAAWADRLLAPATTDLVLASRAELQSLRRPTP